MITLAAAALIGVLHVHHEPSHDSDAPFEAVLAAAHAARLDFVVLAEHVPEDADGPLPGGDRAGFYPAPGAGEPGESEPDAPLLVLSGGEFGTLDGHLLGYGLPRALPTRGLDGAQAIEAIHALGGFAVVPHPFHFGGWHAWDADFDGIEVSNHASALRDEVGPLLPFRLMRLAFDRASAMRARLARPHRELARWDELHTDGRRVVAFQGGDVHENVSVLGWRIDRYREVFDAVHTVCPDGPRSQKHIWEMLRAGRCAIRFAIFEELACGDCVEEKRMESGRVELQLDGGQRVLEIRQFPD